MELSEFLRRYRKNKKLSVRKFAEILDVNKYRLEKWEVGIQPNYEDSLKIKRYFNVKDIQNFSEQFLESFDSEKIETPVNEILRLKDLLLEEKDKRIQNLEETINILMEAQAKYATKKG